MAKPPMGLAASIARHGWLLLLAAVPLAGLAHARVQVPQKRTVDKGVADSPGVRTTASNRVPACVTPEAINQHLAERNPRLEARFRDIGKYYKQHGEAYRIRWDYAFYQMLLETNALSFMRSPGRPGDVKPRQNNFAGIGATGGGVPGESYPDVSTGVLVQMQHLVAYSGELVTNPASPRTRENQADIVAKSKRLGRHVTFRDLTNRWAIDGSYNRSIELVAGRFRDQFCNGPAKEPPVAAPPPAAIAAAAAAPEPKPANRGKRTRTARAEQAAAADPVSATPVATAAAPPIVTNAAPPPVAGDCKVWSASYGGRKARLIRANAVDAIHFTALEVVDGFEESMTRTYIANHAPGGESVADFDTQQAALSHAFALCRTAG